jgi:hypothetical protein
MAFPVAPSANYVLQKMVRLNDGRLFAIANHGASVTTYHLLEWTAK